MRVWADWRDRMKLKNRAIFLTVSAGVCLVFLIMSLTLNGPADQHHPPTHSPDLIFRSGHLAAARMLVDKSSWMSNHSSPEYVFKNPAMGRKVNNIPESIRRMFLFKPKPEMKDDLSKDYVNEVFKSTKLDKKLFSLALKRMSPNEVIYHINEYRHQARRKGKPMNVFDESAVKDRGASLRNWEKWYLNISQYELYRHDDPIIDKILHDLATEPIIFSKQLSGGTQLKLKVTFEDDLEGLFKPMRFPRDVETLLNHYYFSDFERHHAEIAAFHLDKVLGFRRAPPVSGRILNITEDIEQYATPRFLKTMFWSPVGNRCFYGKCSYYCDSNHAICGHPDWIEGSVAAFLPPDDIAPRTHRRNPWRRSYSRREQAEWQEDADYCADVHHEPPFDEGRVLIDLIDIHIFDFLQANMDRHHYEVFEFPDDWKNDTTPVILDNGRGFGKIYRDELDILAPLYQCCLVRHSTLQKLLLFDEGPYKLSELMDVSTSNDPLYPILVKGHLTALDRRVKIILKEIQKCIKKKSSWNKVVIDDGF